MTHLLRLTRLANKQDDGHLTIFKFTTGWKAMTGTPDLDSSYGREEVGRLPAFSSLEKAAEWAVTYCIYDPHLGCPNWPNCDEMGCHD